MKKVEMNDFELENVVGGVLTEEAQAWVNTNKDTIMKRARQAGLGTLANYALSYVQSCSETIDLATVKSTISQYIDINDL